jgi:hypothetical protein
MPAGDIIFERLRAATNAEIAAAAKPLGVELTPDRETNVVAISAELRSVAGNSFANIFRDAHELDYREILVDAARAAAERAGWPAVKPPDRAENASIEEYIIRAMAFRDDPATETLDIPAKARLREQAEAILNGAAPAGVDVNAAAPLGALAVGVGAVAVGVGALPFGLAYALLKYSAPSVQKSLASTAVLIHIRKRLEAEAQLSTP